uniref:YqaJ viral recombinase domain-containing protein n=1 Tax=Kalanchoe fedtschenkoi TaxID=63787 RepID=A0A7N0VJ81_KALFE
MLILIDLSSFSLRPPSLFGSSSILRNGFVVSNCEIMSNLSAMSNVYRPKKHCIQRSAQEFYWRVKHQSLFSLRFSASSSKLPLRSETASGSTRPGTSLVLSACVTESNAPQRSEEWFALRRDKLTTSTFGTALGFWKGDRRGELWKEKVFSSETQPAQTSAMSWGTRNESVAIDCYKNITGRDVDSLGFAIHAEEKFEWLGASPDGLLGCLPDGGILEVKCPFNKGKPELGLPWSAVPFYYMPQVQGQMEIMGREWAEIYCWTPNGSTIFRVERDRSYWQLIHGVLREFWWENVIPAREALLLGLEHDVNTYKPESTHKLTGLAIAKSIQLAAESKLMCREIAGHAEFFRSEGVATIL